MKQSPPAAMLFFNSLVKCANPQKYLARACLCLGVALALPIAVQAQTLNMPVAEQPVASTGVLINELAANAPGRYTVKKGDTLWGISGLFLKNPWQWPQLWGMNKTLIKNPHWIYPGQTLVLTRKGDRASLGFADGIEGLPNGKLSPSALGAQDVKLSPTVRSEALDMLPISSVQLDTVSQFLSQPLILDEPAMNGSGYILTGPENRVYAGVGDTIYARNLPVGEESRFQVYRPGKPLYDPQTRALIAYEAYYLGTAEMQQNGDPARLKILNAKEEMGRGDRLLPAVRDLSLSYSPRSPDKAIDARVMSSYSGVTFAGSNMVVTLNKGRSHGLELGHVLAIWRAGIAVQDAQKADQSTTWSRLSNAPETVKLPDEKYGHVIVFRLFENVAYALVLGTTLPVIVGDQLTQP